MQITLKNRLISFYRKVCFALQRDTWPSIKRCDVLLVRNDNDCGCTFQGKAYSPIVDTFGEFCSRQGLTVAAVATPNSLLHGDLAFHSPVSYNQSNMLIQKMGLVITFFLGSTYYQRWSDLRYITVWSRILDLATPSCIIAIQPDPNLCRAGKIKKIPVYDLQHGIIADDNPWYGEKYRLDSMKEDLPDGFLCWDDQSAATIIKWAVKKGIRVLNIGNLWFQRFAVAQPDDLLVKQAVAEGQEFFVEDPRPGILVTLQWGLSMEYPDQPFNGVMVDALEKVILDTLDDYNWILRLHPAHLRGVEYELLFNYLTKTFGHEKTQVWLKTSTIPLPVVLSRVALHLTDCSTVVVEAGWMGIRSGILNPSVCNGKKYQSYFVQERNIGMADILPQRPEEIKQWIIYQITRGVNKIQLNDSSRNRDTFIKEITSCKKS